LRISADELLIVFVAPPWGDALDPVSGLDLRRTQPSVPAIVDLVARRFSSQKVLLATQVHEKVVAASLTDAVARCQWSQLKIYDINDPGTTMASSSPPWAGGHERASPATTGTRRSIHRPAVAVPLRRSGTCAPPRATEPPRSVLLRATRAATLVRRRAPLVVRGSSGPRVEPPAGDWRFRRRGAASLCVPRCRRRRARSVAWTT
jgi:hypothetical protein